MFLVSFESRRMFVSWRRNFNNVRVHQAKTLNQMKPFFVVCDENQRNKGFARGATQYTKSHVKKESESLGGNRKPGESTV